MPKVVKTPSGQVLVLSGDELLEIHEGLNTDLNEKKCPFCGKERKAVEVYNPVFRSATTQSLEAKEADEMASYETYFCLPCQGKPLYAGTPVVMLGSYYNKGN